MPAHREPLTDRQLAVLQWIADGCPDDVWPDHSHKLSVGALETRNLASIRRWYGKWNAVLMPDGEYYLEHGMYPAGEAARDRPPAPATPLRRPTPPPRSTPRTKAERRERVLPPPRQPSPTEKLIAEVAAAGGELTIKVKGYDEERRVRARVHAAERNGRTDDGRELIIERPNWETYVLKLVPVPEWSATPIGPIEVPDSLRRPHAAVVRLRDDPSLLSVQGARNRNRVLRILQALVKALVARGHEALDGKDQDHLRVRVQGHTIGLHVSQLSDRTDHVPTKTELAERERWSWKRIPQYDYTPSERLKIELTGYRHNGSWSDGKRWTLDSRLERIVEAIERASVADERARLAQIERKRQAKLAEERRIARATERMIHANRVKVFDEQVVDWLRSRQITDYLEAMEAVVEAIDDPVDGVAAGEWLAWCRTHAETIDPLQSGLRMPDDPEPTGANLVPFLERPTYGFMRT